VYGSASGDTLPGSLTATVSARETEAELVLVEND
jgi:hypothetical protein